MISAKGLRVYRWRRVVLLEERAFNPSNAVE